MLLFAPKGSCRPSFASVCSLTGLPTGLPRKLQIILKIGLKREMFNSCFSCLPISFLCFQIVRRSVKMIKLNYVYWFRAFYCNCLNFLNRDIILRLK